MPKKKGLSTKQNR